MSARTLNERLSDDLKEAMRSGDAVSRDTIRFLRAGVKNAEIDKRRPLTSDEEIAFLQGQAKRMVESIEQYRAGNRVDLAEREEAQLAVLRRYLPEPLTDAELKALVDEAIAETHAASAKDLGKVMPVAIAKAQGRADGKRLSGAVREALAAKTPA